MIHPNGMATLKKSIGLKYLQPNFNSIELRSLGVVSFSQIQNKTTMLEVFTFQSLFKNSCKLKKHEIMKKGNRP